MINILNIWENVIFYIQYNFFLMLTYGYRCNHFNVGDKVILKKRDSIRYNLVGEIVACTINEYYLSQLFFNDTFDNFSFNLQYNHAYTVKIKGKTYYSEYKHLRLLKNSKIRTKKHYKTV